MTAAPKTAPRSRKSTKRVATRPATVKRLEKSRDSLVNLAVSRMADELPWFSDLSAQTRSYVALVAQAGIAGFVTWVAHPDRAPETAQEVFGAAPQSMASEVSLQQVVDLVRLVVDVIEEQTPSIAAEGDEAALHESVLLYSREVAFGAALVYAAAAEQRGAWDARLEALVIDALVAGTPNDDILARAAAFGWDATQECWVIVGAAQEGPPEVEIERLRRAARGMGLAALAGVHGRHLVALVGCTAKKEAQRIKLSADLSAYFGDGEVVFGPRASDLRDATRSAASALAGLDAVAAWPRAPRPVAADDLLAERVIAGDPMARQVLINEIYAPLLAASPDLVKTLEVLIDQGGSLEASARNLFVHTNTVRYRLRKILELVSLDPTNPRDALTLATALRCGLLQQSL